MPILKTPAHAVTTVHPSNASVDAANPTAYGVSQSDRDLRAILAVERKRGKADRRKQIDPTTCDRDYSGEELEFMRAMDDYKRQNGRMFPTCSEILEVLRSLGYTKPSRGSSAADTSAQTSVDSRPIDPAAEALATVDALASTIDGMLNIVTPTTE